ncbi:MAG: SPFH domain-containing protein [Pseudomonadota bacterium]
MQQITDKPAVCSNGFLWFFILAAMLVFSASTVKPLLIPVIIIVVLCLTGFTIVSPNEAKVITFFGKYIGTIKQNGFLFTIPLSVKKTVSLKLTNFVTDHLKVNDLNGNPIEIGAIVVWRVIDSAQASLNIDNYKSFLANQSDMAIRTLAAHYPYDSEKETSLRGNIDEVAAKLKEMLQDKLAVAGIIIEDIKLTHLAYSPEIASAMLKRQQAVAIFQARQYMVENALAIIDEVMKHFQSKSDIKISDDKRAELINSLLIVMTSDKESAPVLNLGR